MRLALFLLVFTIRISSGQNMLGEVLQPATGFGDGVVVLNDGKELHGLLRYNDKTGVLSYENGKDTRSLISRNVLGFEYDDGNGEHRIFITIEHEDRDRNVKTPLFFEVLRQFDDFAVLSRSEPVTAKVSNDWYGQTNRESLLSSDKVSLHHVETIYFMHPSGKLEGYLDILRKEINGGIFDRTAMRTKYIEKDVFEKFTSGKYEELRKYAKKNNLEFDEKEDILVILDHYKKLIGK